MDWDVGQAWAQPRAIGAAVVVRNTIGQFPGVALEDSDWYCIIHVIQWATEDETSIVSRKITQDIRSQRWYLFRGGRHPLSGEEFSSGRRIFGSKRVWLLYIHLNSKLKSRYEPDYLVKLTKKDPSNVQALKEIIARHHEIAGIVRAKVP